MSKLVILVLGIVISIALLTLFVVVLCAIDNPKAPDNLSARDAWRYEKGGID